MASSRTIAIIGASYLQRPLVEKAKEMGLRTIVFAWREGAVCEGIADVFYPVSIVEKEEILEICRKERIDGICTIASDVAAPTVAYVADALGLPGNTPEAALKANNKFLMREAFSRAGVPCPGFRMVKTPEFDGARDLVFPLIVKPSDRSGSLGVTKVYREEDLKEAVEKALGFSFRKEAMVEEFLDGREISVEFISYKGVHYPLQITDKVTTEAPHFVELEHHQPSTLPEDVQERIYGLTEKALDALGIEFGASHTEYKITSDGRIGIMELGGRMGGDFIGSDLVRLSTGYDFVEGVIKVALGEFNPPEKTLRRHSGVYFLCRETERLLPVFERGPQSWTVRMERTSDELKNVECSADRSGYVIYCDSKKVIL